ncbi:putative quinol monooxygenase [Bauldia litoralis]|uniref:Quinol monooxygenase YgiN n=1 Tax=Bauldia litoralis TaxID=665467 RepID=A0A1G6DSK9_9HYPH|nr:putative quinol monooxygenase [Bauldia litoralis]SDB48154.1 Quinol monooxygenase YgiN [Bauldia litoralis]
MIIVTGHLRVAPDAIEALRPAAKRTLEATRQEKGCILYAFAEDLIDPGLIRIVERWEDWPSLEAHGKAPHMDAWRADLKNVEIIDREVIAHGAGEERIL